MIRSLLLVLLIGSLAGCVSTVKGLYVAPSFTYQSLMKDKIGVGGVVSVKRNLLPAQQVALTALLRSAIVSQYPGIKVITLGRIVRALDSLNYESMMQLYRFDGQVPSKFLEIIKQKIPQMRYVVFIRIMNDLASYKRETATSYKVKMAIRLRGEVYDLQTMAIVWSGHIIAKKAFKNGHGETKVTSNRYVKGKKKPTIGLIGRYGESLIEEHHAYPSTIDFKVFMMDVFNKIVSEFPKRIESVEVRHA